MPDPREDLRSTGESILRDAAQVMALEREKLKLDPADPRVDTLSARVERLAGGIEDKAKAEHVLSEEITSPND